MTTAPPSRLVLCDDAADFVRLLRLLLELEHDIEVVGEAFDGEQAIDVCARTQPDLLVLDVSMPNMDGLTALPTIRRVSPDTKVVMLSGFGSGRTQQRALDLGAVEFIEKGIAPDALAGRLRAHLVPANR